jgi:hypothetical protein
MNGAWREEGTPFTSVSSRTPQTFSTLNLESDQAYIIGSNARCWANAVDGRYVSHVEKLNAI